MGGAGEHAAKVTEAGVDGGPVAVEGVRGEDIGVDQLLSFEREGGPQATARMPVETLAACSFGRICTMDS